LFSRAADGHLGSVRLLRLAPWLALLLLAAASTASASITVAANVERPALRVDARGYAEVSWTAGARRYLLVPPTGRVYPGRRLSSRDVSVGTTAVVLPFRRVLRRTPDGRLWALQTWRVRPGGPVELRFSRWRGAPPRVTLSARPQYQGELLTGRATFAGRAVPLWSPTPEGKRLRTYVYVDRWTGRAWSRVAGAATRTDGTFRLFVPAASVATRYRAVLPGPNVGASLAPDVISPAVASSR
jgi:hypothetical protein